ncbi:MAG: DUF3109 family protein [Bacteroidia bacterium]|jgi:hypothetical protein|nr:DUF3109 family protein [Bacteroidia bacterium]
MIRPTVIEIDNILVSSEIFTEKFICDIPKCHGACCIIGDSGAPLEQGECDILTGELESISPYLRNEGILSVKEQGPFIRDIEGDLVTPLIKGEECAYTVFDKENNCFCGIEMAHRARVTNFRKPVSCWLYPIRVTNLSNGMKALNLHQWHICVDAYVKGKKEGVPVFRFLQEPLTAAFGKGFYDKLEEAYRLLLRNTESK